ncbi:hypothetical protein FVF58_08010 [Paraburkholderia panacisoli]|jgi:hypothetical protein|uniref:Uncharacterized protein n=1 Tax=Paraburkholderia panacisoli TaxID=2603818 RepID=A0A5B0HEA1_9BURK|nr:hypothetical protein [Paraburkholderia panacisoli]KAA1013676.1 hypothetical protein FVF58_08010 [Paraburkholderia panacisoli]
MPNHSLIWAAVPHNSDGVVFQIRIVHGLQRFHLTRRVLEDVFDLEPAASDARQLERFYLYLNRILAQAGTKRSIASLDTVPLQATDFTSTSKEQRESGRHAMARSAA